MSSPKVALDPPKEDLALMTRERLDETVRQSRKSSRGRIIAPLHRTLSDPLHRMLNAMQPGSYVRPHRHLDPPKAEASIVLRGAVLFVTFFEDGRIRDHRVLNADSETFGVDLVPGHYHTLAALKPDIGFLTTHPTEGEFPFFADSVRLAQKLVAPVRGQRDR